MLKNISRRDRFNWRLPVYSVLCAIFLYVPVAIGVVDSGGLLYALAGLIFSVVLVAFLLINAISKKPRTCMAIILMLGSFWAISAVLLVNYSPIRDYTRWMIWSRAYKAEALAKPVPPSGELRHLEWDFWGWAGEDTSVFLIFDPTDSLSGAAASHRPGKFSGLPCEVYIVRRLESHWYSAQFYMNDRWDRCR